MRTFIENYLHFMKNCIRPHYEKLKPLKSGFIENSNFENDRDPCEPALVPDRLIVIYSPAKIYDILEKYLSFGSRTWNRKHSLQVPLPDAKGAIRMKGSERLENGRCKVKASTTPSQIRFPLLVSGEFAVSYLAGRYRVQELQVHIGLWKVSIAMI